MKFPANSFLVLGLFFAAASLGGCTTVVVETAQAAFEDRKSENQIIDAKIKAGIVERLAKRDKKLIFDISTDVWNQRTMVTGTLDSLEEKNAVVALAKKDKRIKSFYDNIQIVTPQLREQRRKDSETKNTSSKSGFGQFLNDFWIEAKIKAKLLTASDVTSINYRWRSVLNNIYVIGQSPDSKELSKVLGLIRSTEGVKQIKHYIRIKPNMSS
ncbi:MAG: BON domain-containing protein [Rhodospirillales bacterium]|nr:BON domain-containing protein [Rhodospirillales bacterium]